jgi:hypothetical protein
VYKHLLFFALLSAVYIPFDTFAMNTPPTDESSATRDTVSLRNWYDMFLNIPNDWINFTEWSIRSEQVPLYMTVAGSTAGLIATDNATWNTSDKWYKSSNAIKRYSDAFVTVGDGKSQFGLGAGFAAYGLVFGDHKAVNVGSEIIQAVLSSGSVVQVLKHVTGRESPYVSTRKAGRWDFFPNQITYHKRVPHYDAFPSGHLTTTIAAFTVIIENYPDSKWMTPVAAAASTCLGVSMVNTGIHWYSDYPLALVLGYTFGNLAVHPHWGEKKDGEETAVITPVITSHFSGLGLYVAL